MTFCVQIQANIYPSAYLLGQHPHSHCNLIPSLRSLYNRVVPSREHTVESASLPFPVIFCSSNFHFHTANKLRGP
jgi:hypothetical protein